MGFLVGDKCYETSPSAVDAYYSAKEPTFTPGSTGYMQWFEKSGSTWLIKRMSFPSSGAPQTLANQNAPVPTFPTCDERGTFTDGIALGWLLVGIMVLAWGAVMVRRQLT